MLTKTILILAQTPPPFHGQAVMQQYLVEDEWDWCSKKHIRLDYSDTIKEVGHFRLAKLRKLVQIILQVWRLRISSPIDVLYYPPAGPKRIPLYRDIITLLLIKLCARRVILHFHAGGLSELIERLNPIEKFLTRLAFRNIDHAIVLLPWLKREVGWFAPRNIHVIPNGIKDVAAEYAKRPLNKKNSPVTILFVGNLIDEKGVFVLLSAITKMTNTKHRYCVRIMGEAHSIEIQERIQDIIRKQGLEDRVVILGSLVGDKKWMEFAQADIFCLPTYATEAMPVSILEAMMFSLPVVSTNWRGIPDLVSEGIEGYLVPVQNADALAEKLSLLVDNLDLASEMGLAGRKRYESSYRIDRHLAEMEEVFNQSVLVS